MITFRRYPHVKDLIEYYANDTKNDSVLGILTNGATNQNDAEELSRFIWHMADKMSIDCNNNKQVLGHTDNSEMLPDVEYEITLYLDQLGYINIWDRISDEENP